MSDQVSLLSTSAVTPPGFPWVFPTWPHQTFGTVTVICADALEWMRLLPGPVLHAIVTDPPYGLREYSPEHLRRRVHRTGGAWRIPPSFDGHTRAPLPRFTDLNLTQQRALATFFQQFGELARQALYPGGHLLIASNVVLSQTVFAALVRAGLEFRGQIVRLVRTMRGGDRPKGAENEFPGVCSLPRGCHEPWGVFRNPVPRNMTLGDCLRRFQTGGLRRFPDGRPFPDVLASGRTPWRERQIAPHPSLKPQAFLRQVVYAALPLGTGIVADPFMGSGSTLAAAAALGYTAIGVENHLDYYQMSLTAIPALANIKGTSP